MSRLVVLLALAGGLATAWAPAGHAATWCGADETAADRPDVVTGAQVHLVYAFPSDGVSAFATFASEMATDAESIDAWWRREDPTRTPRFDLAAFPACVGLDLGVVRLPLSAAQLLPSGNRFTQIFNAMPRFDRWKKVLVYYDGPVGDPGLCGTASGSPSTGSDSLAVIYARSTCARTQSLRAAVAVHELTHSLGSPDRSQRHPCPGDTGHVCDTDRDLMYPVLSADSLDVLLLDAGRDDYYRWGGTGFDLSSSAWLRRLEGPQQALTVAVAKGAGSVRSDVPGVACVSCTTQWDFGTRVVLAPLPASGQRFIGWSGDCTGLDCIVTMSAPVTVQALFGPAKAALRVTATGSGRVLGGAIACPKRCSANVDIDWPLKLTARPAAGWKLARWTGACSGSKPTCRIVPRSALAVGARFVKR